MTNPRWAAIEIPRDCIRIYVSTDESAVKIWEEKEGRKIILINRPSDYRDPTVHGLPGVFIGYVPGLEDHRLWESLDPPTLARKTENQ